MRTQAIIIKKQDSGEYDQMVWCYTKDFGKVLAVAKGSLRSYSVQGPQLDILNLVEFELVNGKNLPIITATQLEDAHRDIKSSVPKLALSYFTLEIFDKAVFDLQKDSHLWDFLNDTINEIREMESVSVEAVRNIQKKMISVLGYEDSSLSDDMPGRGGDSIYGPSLRLEEITGRKLCSLALLYSVIQ